MSSRSSSVWNCIQYPCGVYSFATLPPALITVTVKYINKRTKSLQQLNWNNFSLKRARELDQIAVKSNCHLFLTFIHNPFIKCKAMDDFVKLWSHVVVLSVECCFFVALCWVLFLFVALCWVLFLFVALCWVFFYLLPFMLSLVFICCPFCWVLFADEIGFICLQCIIYRKRLFSHWLCFVPGTISVYFCIFGCLFLDMIGFTSK